ncbi:MAG: alpha/beta hydrolase [Pseudonocardia sediminis]
MTPPRPAPPVSAPSRRPRNRTSVTLRVLLGAAAVAVVIWVLLTRWSALLAGHPAYPVLLVLVALAGVFLLVRAARPIRGGRVRAAGRVAAGLGLVVVLSVVVWLRPYAAEPVAVAAAESSPAVEVVDSASSWELRPRAAATGTGVVFHPGALVDPRAYLALLRPLAERGDLVVVVKPPLDVALLAPGAAGDAVAAHPEVTRWAIGGHSLGGLPASSAAAQGIAGVRGLFLWASYPAGDVAGAPVSALSVSGDRDTVIAPDGVAASRAQLPAGTRFVVVAGAVHAFFGDYGTQAGDGTPTTSREDAQRQIVEATASFVGALR